MSAAAGRSRLSVLSGQLSFSQTEPSTSARASPASSTAEPWFSGKAVVLTGAAKGIGREAALQFARLGANLVVADLDGAEVEQLAQQLRQAGCQAVAVGGDITAAGTPARIVQAAADAFGRIDVIINNAGFTWDAVIHKMSQQQWDAMLAVHCTAPFQLVQAAAPLMRDAGRAEAAAGKQPGDRVIINVSSTSGTHGNAGQANYATAKAGMVGLTKTIAKEWGPCGVRCNAIAYGMIDTRLTRAKEGGESISVSGQQVRLGIPGAGAAQLEAFRKSVPLQRMASAAEAAGAMVMLASPLASYVTGQVLEVNGGSYM